MIFRTLFAGFAVALVGEVGYSVLVGKAEGCVYIAIASAELTVVTPVLIRRLKTKGTEIYKKL